LPQGLSARGGIFSAQLAKAGWTGPKEPLLSQFGYFNLFMRGDVNSEILTKDLGKKYYTDQHFKPYPCCAICHPAIDCALKIISKYPINYHEIDNITLFVPKIWLNSYVSQPLVIGTYPHGNTVFNYRYLVANALIRKCIKPEHFSDSAIQDTEIYSLANKIDIRELTRPETELLSAELIIEMEDKQKFHEFTNSTKGNPLSNPLSKEEIISKFQSNIEFSGIVKSKNIAIIVSFCNKLEYQDSVKKLVELL
jgi:2-methylcitrate dehydratase PrpD